jgi:DNA-binding transcriptional ArsR family regulator
MSAIPTRQRIIDALRLAPMTCRELATCLSTNYENVRREISAMVDEGVVYDAGMRKRNIIRRLATWRSEVSEAA